MKALGLSGAVCVLAYLFVYLRVSVSVCECM